VHREGGGAMIVVVVKGALDHARARLRRDLNRAIRAEGIEDHDVVGPRDALQARCQDCFIVAREDQHGDHH
jgi:hypothetical protein